MASKEQIYAAQVKAYNASIAHYQKIVKDFQAKQKKSKDSGKDAWYQKRIDANNKLITSTAEKRVTAQNNLYQVTGQYSKLLSGDNRNAYMALNTLFGGYGLGSLSGKIYDYVKQGYSSDTISILLQDTPEYKKRFAANEARKKAGLAVLSPSEYLSTESSYRQIMRQSGLPPGFYDSNEDFTGFISKDVSPTELQGRVDMATQATALANPEFKKALNQMGISDSALSAYFLDTNKAMPILQKQAATAQIGAEALRRNLAFDPNYAENLATQGITQGDAAKIYTQIGEEYGTLRGLGGIYGGNWTQRLSEQAAFEGNPEANSLRRRLVGQEVGEFAGAAGAARGGLSQVGGAR